MHIIVVTASFSEKTIKPALDVLQHLATQTKGDGACEVYEIHLNASEQTRVQIYQLWQTQAAFENYRTGEAFAKMGKELKPLMTSAPQTAIFDATRIT